MKKLMFMVLIICFAGGPGLLYAIYSRESIQGRDLAKSIANEAKENGIAVKDGGKMTILIQS